METFALRVVNTKVSGNDHHGRLGSVMVEVSHGGVGQVKLQYTMGEVNTSMSARQLKESTQQRSQSIDINIRRRGFIGNANYPNTS